VLLSGLWSLDGEVGDGMARDVVPWTAAGLNNEVVGN
jgi:hypothetical protein